MGLLEYSLIVLYLYTVNAVLEGEFPKEFLFGAASSAYQIEGAWNTIDKGESIWDRLTHTRSDLILNGGNGDVAADSYHRFKEDVQLLKDIGAKCYRFSLSWTRILPDGFSNRISKSGVDYYNALINECLDNDILPMVTIYHWDLPQVLQDLGGWANPDILIWIEDYAELAFRLFGDRVKMWATINEPFLVCSNGYGSIYAPSVNQSGIADYLCGHHVLLAHARINALYDREYRSKQNGKIGIVLSCGWYEPTDNTSEANIRAAERAFDFDVGWFAHPLFSADGDYPESMKTRISERSKQQGYKRSRLPKFTSEQIKDLRYRSDYIGINYYTATSVRDKTYNGMSYLDDAGYESVEARDWKGISWTKNTPWALSKLLRTMTKRYQLPEIYITENGYTDFGGLRDEGRTIYYHDHLQELMKIIRGGIDVKGYVAWSLIDNFQWIEGYKHRLGLFDVDFNRADKPRTPKLSAKFIAKVYRTRRIPNLSNYIHADL